MPEEYENKEKSSRDGKWERERESEEKKKKREKKSKKNKGNSTKKRTYKMCTGSNKRLSISIRSHVPL